MLFTRRQLNKQQVCAPVCQQVCVPVCYQVCVLVFVYKHARQVTSVPEMAEQGLGQLQQTILDQHCLLQASVDCMCSMTC